MPRFVVVWNPLARSAWAIAFSNWAGLALLSMAAMMKTREPGRETKSGSRQSWVTLIPAHPVVASVARAAAVAKRRFMAESFEEIEKAVYHAATRDTPARRNAPAHPHRMMTLSAFSFAAFAKVS